MKKGIFMLLGLLVFSLVSGTAYVANSIKTENLDFEIYEQIVVKNKYGEFKTPFPFAVIRKGGN